MKFKYILIFIISIKLIKCETVHFTNSPNYLVSKKNFTTYKLNVPGSNSITIVEANTQPTTIFKNSFNQAQQQQQQSDTEDLMNSASSVKKTVYAPTLLEKFMNEYNIKVSSAKFPTTETSSADANNKDDNNKVLVKRGYNANINSNNNYYGQFNTNNNKNVNKNSHHPYQNRPSPLITTSDTRNPFNEKEGWVTLQAVPWSKSQVSRWKPDIKPINTGSGYTDYNSPGYAMYQKEIMSKYSTNSNNEMDASASNYPDQYDDDNKNRRYSTRPLSSQSSYDSVPWNTNGNSDIEKPIIEVASNYDRWYDYGFRPDLDRFGKRPQHQSHHPYYFETDEQNQSVLLNNDDYSSNRSPLRQSKPYSNNDRIAISSGDETQYSSNRHPSTHPSKGKGEWVLISTTKGYQHPTPTHSIPRGIKFNKLNDNGEQLSSPINYRTHKSIKLTVLPAKTEDGKLKPMKLSHGGLLEVESSLQTVEDSANASLGKRNKKKIVKRNPSMKLIQAVNNNQQLDKSAVLAAVGAGMVPATMAMLMPMVLGRKKRSLLYPKEYSNGISYTRNR